MSWSLRKHQQNCINTREARLLKYGKFLARIIYNWMECCDVMLYALASLEMYCHDMGDD